MKKLLLTTSLFLISSLIVVSASATTPDYEEDIDGEVQVQFKLKINEKTTPMTPLEPSTPVEPTTPLTPLEPSTPVEPSTPMTPLEPSTPTPTPTTPPGGSGSGSGSGGYGGSGSPESNTGSSGFTSGGGAMPYTDDMFYGYSPEQPEDVTLGGGTTTTTPSDSVGGSNYSPDNGVEDSYKEPITNPQTGDTNREMVRLVCIVVMMVTGSMLIVDLLNRKKTATEIQADIEIT